MASKQFHEDFAAVIDFFGLHADEQEAMKIMMRGNMDAAETFLAVIARRVRDDPRYGINERIKASIAAERAAEEKEK